MSLVINTGPSLTDLSNALNCMDARARLDRALDRNDEAALAAWARTYGASAVRAAETAQDTADLEEAQTAANEAEENLGELEGLVNDAVNKIEAIIDEEGFPEAYANRIGAITGKLAEAA